MLETCEFCREYTPFIKTIKGIKKRMCTGKCKTHFIYTQRTKYCKKFGNREL